MNNNKYILNGHEPVEESSLIKWAKWLETANRRVKVDYIGEIKISTVFLGIDYNFADGKPHLFETMVFGGDLDKECERCSTWDEAEKMHERIYKRVELLVKA